MFFSLNIKELMMGWEKEFLFYRITALRTSGLNS